VRGPRPPLPERADSLVDAALSASRILVAIAARSLADAGEHVTLPRYGTLVVHASRGPQGVAETAEVLSVTPPTASRLCEPLVRKGLLYRRACRTDRRQVRIGLTRAGRRIIDDVSKRRRLEITNLVADVPSEARVSVVKALQQLCEIAGEVPEQDWSLGWDL
jgi:DNA-binding MarR family transcriptional regulator